MVSEIILCTKEVNKRTRAAAYDLLVQIGHAMHEEEPPGRAADDSDDDAMGKIRFSMIFTAWNIIYFLRVARTNHPTTSFAPAS